MIDTASRLSPARYNATSEPPPVVGPAQPSAPRELPTNKAAMGRDEFLKMLVAQLKNQDPLNPSDGKEMAAQLAQFSTVEQLISMNKAMETQASAATEVKEAIQALEKAQTEQSDSISRLIEGQMAMGTVGKIGVTTGDTAFVDRDGKGTVVVDTGSLTGTGRITVTDARGRTVGVASVDSVKPGQQSFELGDLAFQPPLAPGTYRYKMEVAPAGGPLQSVKTYTAGRITGMKYDNGNPILLIGDALQVPMSKLIQVRS